MARSTPVIATVGASLLVVAVAAAAIRGTDDSGQPATQPTDAMTATTEAPEGTDTPDATPSPTEPASPTEDATTPDDVEAEGTAAPTEPDGDGDQAGGGGTDDTDATDDDADGDSDDELPETGGGGLALLGASLAVAGATAGRRHRTT